MNSPHRPATAPSATALAALRPWTVTPGGSPARAMPLTRRYEILWLDSDGRVQEMTRVAPAMPAFEAPFSALARGALVEAPGGPVAIEDLLPGTLISTQAGPRPVRWIGRMTLPPANLRQDEGPDIFRLIADAFGHGRPAPDLVLCSGARLVRRIARLAAPGRSPEVLVPVAEFADGVHVTLISPVSPVSAFHLALDEHAAITVNGLQVESFHPGPDLHGILSGEFLRLWLSMFPHLRAPSDFGPLALPRLSMGEIEALALRA